MERLSHQNSCNSHSHNSYPSSNLWPTFSTKTHASNPVFTDDFLYAHKKVMSLFYVSYSCLSVVIIAILRVSFISKIQLNFRESQGEWS